MTAEPILLPFPRSLKLFPGFYTLPKQASLVVEGRGENDPELTPVVERLRAVASTIGTRLNSDSRPRKQGFDIQALRDAGQSTHAEAYVLEITRKGVSLRYSQDGGFRAGMATLRQLLRQYGRGLPLLVIHDWPDFARRGVMLDISRGRVPRLQTLMQLVEDLADFKINEFQLYIEHTFAYRGFGPVWRGWGALTGGEIRKLDARCRQLGIDLVPNQNSFGHLRYWLEYPPLRRLAEVSAPYEGSDGSFLRYPTTLAPNHPGTFRFLKRLYDELLPCFSSHYFNVGCDETWDLGRGQSKALCARLGKGRVYLEFIKRIHSEVAARGKGMMFWGDIILHYPELIAELPKDIIALNWGYEANHPFQREAAIFQRSGYRFYVCPGTSTWMSLIGRHDNALLNLRRAAETGRAHGAAGFLNTDWGDGGHPQPLAVSYLPYLAGAALSWCAKTFDERLLVPVLSRDIFFDPTQQAGEAALALGLAHRRFRYLAPNVTPFGTVITAPPPERRELFCRDGLKYYARIPQTDVRSALEEVEQQRRRLITVRSYADKGSVLLAELELAARMAAHSCKFMLWQQALAAGETAQASMSAKKAILELRELDREFRDLWPSRNKGTTAKCSAFLRWRIEDYRRGRLHFPPDLARA